MCLLCFIAEGVSDELANYMTMALDPKVGLFVKYQKRNFGYIALLQQLQRELNVKLITSKLTMLGLYQKIAIR